MGIQRHVHASVDLLPPGNGVTIYSQDLAVGIHAASVADLRGDFEFLEGFVKRLVEPEDSILLVTESDVPAAAGLGGSAALGVAIVAAIDQAYGRTRKPAEVAALANEIERKDLGYPGGDQDSYGAALGGIHRLECRLGAGQTIPHRIAVPDATHLTLEQQSVLIYTSEAHVSGDIHQDIKDSYALENSPTLDAMMQLRDAASRMSEALEEGSLDGYVDALNTSSRNLYRLHPSCDSEAHRRCFEELGDCILGGKTCGAGGGGFLLVYAAPGRRMDCIRKAEALGASVWPFRIDFEGVRQWSERPTSPSEVERFRELAKKPSP